MHMPARTLRKEVGAVALGQRPLLLLLHCAPVKVCGAQRLGSRIGRLLLLLLL